MKTKTLAHLALLCALPFALACAKKNTDKKTVEPTPALPVLAGDYTSDCVVAGPTSFKTRMRFATDAEGKPVELAMKTISDFTGRCNTLTSSTDIYYTYKLSGLRAANLFNIDYVETDYQLTPATIDVAANWNRTRVCERSDWEVNVPRSIDKNANNCVAGDRVNKRPLYSVLKVEGNSLFLGVAATREQDGFRAETRETGVGELPLVKGTTATPAPVTPTGCPNLDGLYACTQGDAVFAGKDITVATQVGNDRRTIVQMSLSRAGSRPEMEIYQPSDGDRVSTSNGIRFVTRDACEPAKLTNSVAVSRASDGSKLSQTVKEFAIGDRGSLNIITRETQFQDNRPGREVRTDTRCDRR